MLQYTNSACSVEPQRPHNRAGRFRETKAETVQQGHEPRTQKLEKGLGVNRVRQLYAVLS